MSLEKAMAAAKACPAKAVHEMTGEEFCGAVLNDDERVGGLIFNRPPADPNAPPKSHPIIDSIKALITSFVETMGPQIMDKLGPLILQLLSNIGKTA